MKQKTDEKIDPLTRIQEEIKEVVRREEEYRQLTSALNTPTPPVKAEPFTVTLTAPEAAAEQPEQQAQEEELQEEEEQQQGVLASALLVPIEEQSPSNTPSLASSVNSSHKEESLDDHHSDDSGISSSSLKKTIIGNNSKDSGSVKAPLKLSIVGRQEQRYIGPNCYNLTPEPPQQKLLTRTISTTQPNAARQFAFNGATKGVMQRFIASHGKLSPATPNQGLSNNSINLNNINNNNNTLSSPTLKLNSRNAAAFIDVTNGNASPIVATPASNNNNNNISSSSNGTLSQGAIERDSEGRPLRRGYVPVEQKIQRELQDLKSRETELKRLRKLNRQYLLSKASQSTEEESDDNDNDDDSEEEEHCYGPGKLRNAQSTVELDRESVDLELIGLKSSGNRSLNMAAALANGTNNNSLSNSGSSFGGGMRPAMSLAQLCDLTPEEAPSSHRLIAQWESLIKKNAEGIEAAI